MSEIIVRLKDNRIKITGGEYVRDLVRCKDCKYYETDGGALMVCEVSALNTNDNDFCSYGEKEDK